MANSYVLEEIEVRKITTRRREEALNYYLEEHKEELKHEKQNDYREFVIFR